MDLIDFDITKTLEQLEIGGKEGYHQAGSSVFKAHKLRKKALKDFSNEELCLMVTQNSSLKYMVPLAIQRLQVDSLIKGDGYEGDLLSAVLTVEKKFWIEDLKGCISMLEAIIKTALATANSKPLDYEKFLQHSKGAINIFKTNVGLI